CFQLTPPSELSSRPCCMSPARIRPSRSTASAITFPPTWSEASENERPPSRERYSACPATAAYSVFGLRGSTAKPWMSRLGSPAGRTSLQVAPPSLLFLNTWCPASQIVSPPGRARFMASSPESALKRQCRPPSDETYRPTCVPSTSLRALVGLTSSE